MRYRVNFGNGQVQYCGGLKSCMAYVRAFGDGHSFIQFQDNETGDWFTYKGAKDNE